MAGFTHCRCGAEATYVEKGNTRKQDKRYLHRKCPNADDGRGYVYHELIAQQAAVLFNRRNWEVVKEENGYRAYAGDYPSTTLFETEQAAYDVLDQAMWSHGDSRKHWADEDESDAA